MSELMTHEKRIQIKFFQKPHINKIMYSHFCWFSLVQGQTISFLQLDHDVTYSWPGLRCSSTSSPTWFAKNLFLTLRLLEIIGDVCLPSIRVRIKTKIPGEDENSETESLKGPGQRELRCPTSLNIQLVPVKLTIYNWHDLSRFKFNWDF